LRKGKKNINKKYFDIKNKYFLNVFCGKLIITQKRRDAKQIKPIF